MPIKQIPVKGREVDLETIELAGFAPALEIVARIGTVELRESHVIGAADGRGAPNLDADDEQQKLDAHRQALAERAELLDRAKQIGGLLT